MIYQDSFDLLEFGPDQRERESGDYMQLRLALWYL